jgi:hypothetical protein
MEEAAAAYLLLHTAGISAVKSLLPALLVTCIPSIDPAVMLYLKFLPSLLSAGAAAGGPDCV